MNGVIQSVEGNWVSVETKQGVEALNPDYINRICELPEKKPKKK